MRSFAYSDSFWRMELKYLERINKEIPEIVLKLIEIVVERYCSLSFYVDKSYIAIPQKHTGKVDSKILEIDGIGLISVDGSAEIVIDAKKSERTLE